MAQRVMDCGDGGHILLSRRVAEDLEQYRQWQPHLHALGECEVKHGVRVHLVNLYRDELGNRAPPQKLKRFRELQNATTPKSTTLPHMVWPAVGAVVLVAAFGLIHLSNHAIELARVVRPPDNAVSFGGRSRAGTRAGARARVLGQGQSGQAHRDQRDCCKHRSHVFFSFGTQVCCFHTNR